MSRAKAKKTRPKICLKINLSNKTHKRTFPQESHIKPKATHSIHKTGAQL